jgi:hypothetical protein
MQKKCGLKGFKTRVSERLKVGMVLGFSVISKNWNSTNNQSFVWHTGSVL